MFCGIDRHIKQKRVLQIRLLKAVKETHQSLLALIHNGTDCVVFKIVRKKLIYASFVITPIKYHHLNTKKNARKLFH